VTRLQSRWLRPGVCGPGEARPASASRKARSPPRSARLDRSDAVRALGFDERFIRRWEYYLALSEASFATGVTQDLQIVMEKRRGVDA
jgi:hypothetical protein